MSFHKINDPAKRDFIVQEYLKTKRNIQKDFLSERVGDISMQHELTKLYKPITDAQTSAQIATQAALQENLGAIKSLPTSLTLPQYPSIDVFEDAPEEPLGVMHLGELATKFMKDYANKKDIVDKLFGIRSENGQLYIGTKPIIINGDDIVVDDTSYKGTPGLWELITMKDPNKTIYDNNDFKNYGEILIRTNAISQEGNPNKPKSSKSSKYNEIVSQIWKNRHSFQTTGSSIVIPQDPNALVEMLKLRLASFNAGNTGVRNEIVIICDELLRQGQINRDDYKN